MDRLGHLSRREREIMEIVYGLGEATVKQVRARMVNAPTRPALRSLLGILEEKGELRHTKAGREFVYRPTRSRERVGCSALGQVVATFFGGSLERAVAAYLGDPIMGASGEEFDKLAGMIETIATDPVSGERRPVVAKEGVRTMLFFVIEAAVIE